MFKKKLVFNSVKTEKRCHTILAKLKSIRLSNSENKYSFKLDIFTLSSQKADIFMLSRRRENNFYWQINDAIFFYEILQQNK